MCYTPPARPHQAVFSKAPLVAVFSQPKHIKCYHVNKESILRLSAAVHVKNTVTDYIHRILPAEHIMYWNFFFPLTHTTNRTEIYKGKGKVLLFTHTAFPVNVAQHSWGGSLI